jgi:phenylacetate-CoA ligase
MNDQSVILGHLGSKDSAARLLERAQACVPAYQRFLQSRDCLSPKVFEDRPLTDKQNYLLAYEYNDLLADEYENTFAIFASSGSSGHTFYWPQLKAMHQAAVPALRGFLERAFDISRRKTLAIVGLALGSWIGGEHVSWALKSIAVASPYPFAVFSPGNRHDEIIRMARQAERFVDQILLFVCPSAIAHLNLRAEASGTPLPLDKLRYVVLGEPFPESVRASLTARAGLDRWSALMLSIYGSADTGVLGAESPASVAVRRLLAENEGLRASLDIRPAVPHLFHCAAPDAYLESVGGELCITRWQGIPLLRYNLHDDVLLWRWPALRDAILRSPHLRPLEADLQQVVTAAGDELPDLLAVYGRSDRTVILCGTNLTETMIDQAVRSHALESFLTGVYTARLRYEGDRQRLEFDLEFRAGVPLDADKIDHVYSVLVEQLGRVQPEFCDDWQNVYRIWDSDPDKRILRLNCVAWPSLSQRAETQIKQRGLT